jgi:Domain of unknown function (DUF4747)
MADESVVQIGFVNVVATPHPTGIYATALKEISGKPVGFRGNDFAVVLPPKVSKSDPDLWEGTLSVWTDIDSSEPSIDKGTFEKKNVEEALVRIFAERGFNNRAFDYVLDAKTHTIAVALTNEQGKTISVRQVGKIFSLLFSSLNKSKQTYEVTVVPSEDAIDSVLHLKRLDRVKIVLKRPNPGDHDGGDADEVLRELEEMNTREADYIFVRQPGTDGIHLNEEFLKRARVAATNGYVESSGTDNDGDRQHPSTKEYPKVVKRALDVGATFLSVVRNEAKRFRRR